MMPFGNAKLMQFIRTDKCPTVKFAAIPSRHVAHFLLSSFSSVIVYHCPMSTFSAFSPKFSALPPNYWRKTS